MSFALYHLASADAPWWCNCPYFYETTSAIMPIDPLSVVSLVGSLVTAATKTAIGCHGLVSKYEDAPRALALIEIECKTTRAALSVISDFLLEHATSLGPRLAAPSSSLAELIDLSLTGCTATFGMLDGKIENVLHYRRKDHQVLRWQAHASYLWNKTELDELLQRMRDVKSTLHLLMSALNT